MFYHVMNFFDHFFLKAGFHWAIEGDKKKFKFWWKREDYFFRLLSFTFTNYRRNQNMKKKNYLSSTITNYRPVKSTLKEIRKLFFLINYYYSKKKL